jgi:hypothetical protein
MNFHHSLTKLRSTGATIARISVISKRLTAGYSAEAVQAVERRIFVQNASQTFHAARVSILFGTDDDGL